jgi:hypothetical protein
MVGYETFRKPHLTHAMHLYRCHFLNAEDNIEAFEEIEAGSLADAIARAEVMLNRRPHHCAVEIWAGNRWIFRATRDRAA